MTHHVAWSLLYDSTSRGIAHHYSLTSAVRLSFFWKEAVAARARASHSLAAESPNFELLGVSVRIARVTESIQENCFLCVWQV